MNSTVLGSCLVGGLMGGIVGHFISRPTAATAEPKPVGPIPETRPVGGSDGTRPVGPVMKRPVVPAHVVPDDDDIAICQAIPKDLSSNLNKIYSLSSTAGKTIVSAIIDICRQIAVAASLVSADNDGADGPESNPELKLIVQRTCTKLSEARLLLDKLYTIERSRAGMLEEFMIYKSTVQSELDGFGSCFNNYLTKHIMSS